MTKLKTIIALNCLTVLLMGCDSLINPSVKNSLKEARESGFLVKEDKTRTIGGIDANNDGVRDDIEQYIKHKYGYNPEYVDIYMQYARELRTNMTLASNDRETYRRSGDETAKKMVCAAEVSRKVAPGKMYGETMLIYALSVNTRKRKAESSRISSLMSGMVLSLPSKAHCKK